jgi:hypothetical protein
MTAAAVFIAIIIVMIIIIIVVVVIIIIIIIIDNIIIMRFHVFYSCRSGGYPLHRKGRVLSCSKVSIVLVVVVAAAAAVLLVFHLDAFAHHCFRYCDDLVYNMLQRIEMLQRQVMAAASPLARCSLIMRSQIDKQNKVLAIS